MSEATGGYMGSILVLDLTEKSYEIIDSAPYQEWGGGHGMGSALFWDYCEDKTVGPFDEGNVVTISTSPFSGTPVPAGAGRVEIQGIGSFADPEWFTRSSMGGRISSMMKAAGFDATVIKGKAANHTWINVVNGSIEFRDADEDGLWGLDTAETQTRVWERVTGGVEDGDWYELSDSRDGGRTTQKPAVICIGPASENLARSGTITTDGAHQAGQSGLGAAWGAKNLKCISFVGSKSVPVADPAALLDVRLEYQRRFVYKIDNPSLEMPWPDATAYDARIWGTITRNPGSGGAYFSSRDMLTRPYGCPGCTRNCRHNFDDGFANGSMCAASMYYLTADKKEDMIYAAGLLNRLGINGFDRGFLDYLRSLYKMGILGKGKEIDTDLPFDKYGSREFIEEFLFSIAYRRGIGDTMAEGPARAVKAWGRWEEDSKSGLFPYPQWNYYQHYDPRLEVEWSYGSVLGERDINTHGINAHVHWMPYICDMAKQDYILSAEQVVKQLSASTGLPEKSFDYSEEGIYSDEKVATIAWQHHYSRFWLDSMNLCDSVWPTLINYNDPNMDTTGATPNFEPRMFTAVTGVPLTYEESLERGKKAYLLDRAIWYLQGRTREMETFADYVFEVPTKNPYPLTVLKDGKWVFDDCIGRVLDREKFETVKDRFYEMEGLDSKTGCPTRATLESYGLGYVADALERAGIEGV